MWNLMEQMVILAIRTLFVNSDCNHSHQRDFSYVSVSSVTPRKTYWQQTHCKWSGRCTGCRDPGLACLSLVGSRQVCAGARGQDTGYYEKQAPAYHSQIWNAVNRIPDSCCSQFFNKGNDLRCRGFVKLIDS